MQVAWLEGLRADVRYAMRAFRRSPAFTLTAVASLALGIGANSTIVAALDAILWKPLPVADPRSLVRLSLQRATAADTNQLPLEYVDRLRQSGVFADVIVQSDDGLSLAYDDRAERIVGSVVSPHFFSFLGIRPALGQGFSADVQKGRWAPEAVLSYRFWQRRFGGDSSIIGQTIRLNTYPFTIVGVSPESFFDLSRGFDPELRIPILPAGQELRQIELISGSPGRRMGTIARLKPSTTAAQAEAAAAAPFQEWMRTSSLGAARIAPYRQTRVRSVETGWDDNLTSFRQPLFVLLALVAFVLLITCANVANLLLARGMARQRELAVRASMGASRARLVRQLTTESVLLAVLGGMAGMLIASWGAHALAWFLPQGHLPLVLDLRPDGRMLAFASALSLATGVLFGLVPAFQATRGDLTIGLKTDSAGSSGAAHGADVRRALVIVQVAFSLVLLVVAGLFVRTLSNLHPRDARVPADRVLVFTMKPQREIYGPDRVRSLVDDLQRRMSALPGVQSASLAEYGPLASRRDDATFEADGRVVQAALDLVTPGFFDTVGLPLIAGRDFTRRDGVTSPLVVVVNEALARVVFPGVSPIGRKIRPLEDRARREFEVIGVVSTAYYHDLHAPASPAAWLALLQETPYMPTLHVRAATRDTASVSAAVRREFNAVDKAFPIFDVKTLEARIGDSLSRERMVANISAAFGVLALLLAGIGLYGVLAYSVSRRRREIAIRMALGSDRRAVVGLVVREAVTMMIVGAIAGAAIATLAGHLVSRYLYGVSPFDLRVLLGSSAAMVAMAAIAVSIPAARAARVDPFLVLRSE